MNRNLGYVKALLDAYVPADLMAEIPDSVAMLRLGAHIGRQVLTGQPHAAAAGREREGGAASEASHDAVLDQAAVYRKLRDEAQARGDRRNVSRYDDLERQMLARLGNAPLVGRGRRTT